MFKNDFSGLGLHILCDKCHKILDTYPYTRKWEKIDSPRKHGTAGKGRKLDFCDEKCRIIYLRGHKYYARKLQHIEENWNRELKRMEGN